MIQDPSASDSLCALIRVLLKSESLLLHPQNVCQSFLRCLTCPLCCCQNLPSLLSLSCAFTHRRWCLVAFRHLVCIEICRTIYFTFGSYYSKILTRNRIITSKQTFFNNLLLRGVVFVFCHPLRPQMYPFLRRLVPALVRNLCSKQNVRKLIFSVVPSFWTNLSSCIGL